MTSPTNSSHPPETGDDQAGNAASSGAMRGAGAAGSTAPAGASGASDTTGSSVSLAPSFAVPLAVSLLGALCLPLQPSWGGFRWLALALVLFGGFLLLQARLLRLEFNDEALLVWRGEQEIRCFPYATWLAWRLFWPGLPVLLYFREERSLHLLPVLFDPAALQEQLERHLAHLAPNPAP
jgi:hypothetical protein